LRDLHPLPIRAIELSNRKFPSTGIVSIRASHVRDNDKHTAASFATPAVR
jgi:hypothetical protein